MIIRKATLGDADAIAEIAGQNALAPVEERYRQKGITKRQYRDFLSGGYLVTGYTGEDYRRLLTESQWFLVAEADGRVGAFLLAYTVEEADPYLTVNRRIREYAPCDYVVVKQICARRDGGAKGCASALYRDLIRKVNMDVYAAVVIEKNIRNQRSIDFHQRQGFEACLEFKGEDGLERAVFRYRHPAVQKPGDKDIVTSQYEAAVNLYMHEDNLNWTKLNNFFLVTGGLMAVNGVIIAVSPVICLFVSVLGLLSAWIFSRAIRSGILYLQHRKERIVRLEALMIRMQGSVVVSADFSNSIYRKSLTARSMVLVPKIVTVLWAILVLIFICLSLNQWFRWFEFSMEAIQLI